MPTMLDYRGDSAEQAVLAERKKKQADEEVQRQARAAALAQHNAISPYQLTQEQEQARKAQETGLQRTMESDIAQSVQDPDLAGKQFKDIDIDYRKHLGNAYGPVAGNLARTWNSAQTAQTGMIPGLEHPEKYQKHISIAPTGEATTTLAEKPDTVELPIPAKIRSELIHAGKFRADMTPDEASAEYQQMQTDQGVIPEHLRPFAEKLASQLVRHPILAPFAKQKEAYDTMKSGFENPQSGGFGDMAMIEGFQRIVNPGAVVRQQTMNQMLAAAGLDKYGSWDFFKNKIAQGDKLGPDARKRLMDLAEQTFAHAKTTASRELESKRRYAASMGIPNPNAFVDNILDYIAQTGEADTAAPGTAPAKPATQAPEGAAAYLKQHPETAAAFDAKYGAGSSTAILGK